MIRMPSAPKLNTALVLNRLLFNTMALGWSVFDSARLMRIAIAHRIRKMTPIWSINGIAGHATLKRIERGMVNMATPMAALDVVRFQKSPNKNMVTMPGVTIPVNSWIY